MIAQLMLHNNQLDQAVKGLEDHLATARIKPGIQSKINALLRSLRNTTKPDLTGLTEQLEQVKQQLLKIALPTTTEEPADDAPWYANFVSVKKISEASEIGTSADLAIVKAQLNQHLFQAQLALTMADQTAWEKRLQQTIDLLDDHLPGEQSLRSELASLQAESVVIRFSNEVNIQAIIDELSGLR